MKFIKDTFCFIFQTLLIIFVNFFVADICVYSVWLVILFLQYDVFVSKALNKEWDEISSIYLLPILMLFMLIYIIKNISLPILYYILEKTSKSKLIKKFINNLKHKFIMKLLVLFLSIIPFLIWNKLNDSLLKKEIWSDFFFFCIVFGLFGSYLFLFFFWEVEKWWRREKDKGNKYVCSVCECCVKFRSSVISLLNRKVF